MIARSAPIAGRTLRRLFDPSALQDMLRGMIDDSRSASITDVRVDRCWPRGETGFAFQWSFRIGESGRYTIAGVPLETVKRAKANKSSPARLTPRGVRGLRRPIPDYALLAFSPDCDPALPQLAGCLGESTLATELAQVWSPQGYNRNGQSPTCTSRLLSHKPGRRAAIEYHIDFGRGNTTKLAGKTFRNDAGRDLIEMHRRLNEQLSARGDSRVRVAEPAGFLEHRNLALFRWGQGAGPSQRGTLGPDSIRAAAEGLAALHTLDLDETQTFTALDECRVVARWLDALRRLGIADLAPADRAFDLLRGIAESLKGRPVCTMHGDYYESQVIWNQRRITLLDLDTLALGDPCRDLGNLLAHAHLSCLRAGGSRPAFESLMSAALSQYQAINGSVDRQALKFYHATALLRVGAVHALRTSGRHLTSPMWQAGLSLLSNSERTAERSGVASQRKSS